MPNECKPGAIGTDMAPWAQLTDAPTSLTKGVLGTTCSVPRAAGRAQKQRASLTAASVAAIRYLVCLMTSSSAGFQL